MPMKTKLRPGLALRPLRVLFPVCALFGCLAQGSLALETQVQVLARVEVTAPITALDLPIHAWLQDALGQEYLLVICAESRLAKSTWPYRILDSDARAEEYVLAIPRRAGARTAAAERYSVVHDDGLRLVMRVTPGRAEELAGMGYAIQRLSQEPIVWRRAQPAGEGMPEQRKDLEGFSPNPLLGQMVSRVQPSDLLARLRRVSGEELVVAGGDPYAITTRHTGSGLPVQKATQFAYEQLQALGLDTRYHNWSRSGYTNRNVISTQPGTARSNEVVLITAHLDDMPGGERAPGADDNASGSVAVLTAADLFAQLGFERTVRFVLFTGEEQGLLGSAQYAAEAAAAGDNIVAVFNMDMLAWDHSGGPALRLHTRTTGNPGYSNDLFIASVFTNVVSAYGLSNSLSPILTPNADGASDHASFWNKGYPALYAEEDYPDDFNPYYHSVNDTLANVNLDYFTAFTRAALGTVAHLAAPTGAVSFEAIEVANSDWTPGSGIGAGVFYARHVADATESGPDPRDLAYSNAPPNANSKWLKISTDPYGVDLMTDSRPAGSQTPFMGKLSVIDTTGMGVSCSNRLRFDCLTPPDSNRVYTVRLHIDGRYTQPTGDFDCVTNLLAVIAGGGYVDLPSLNQVSNGVTYGTCEIYCAGNPISLSIVSPPSILPNRHFHVGYSGTPGFLFSIQSSPEVAGPWTTLTNIPAGVTGLFDFEDPTEGVMSRFYRCGYP